QEADEMGARAAREEPLAMHASGNGAAVQRATAHGPVQCKKPGDVPPRLEDQLEARLAVRGEARGELPPPAHVVQALDQAIFMAFAFAPAAINTIDDVIAQGMSDYCSQPAVHNNDFTLFSAL